MDEYAGRIPKERRWLRGEQGRTPYDGLRPWSALTHGAGAVLALLGTVLLVLRGISRGTGWHAAAFVIYGITMTGLYAASTLYHSVRSGEKGRVALRKYDHASIYLLIAGTYTPVCLVALRGPWGWALLGVIWALALGGVALTLRWILAPRWLKAGIYLFMGWLALPAVYPLARIGSPALLFWLFLGGAFYTVGGILYGLRWPSRHNPRFGCHEVFHVFVMLGSVAHFMMMYQVIAFL